MACVVGPEGREEPHATALLLLAAAQSQASEESRRLQEQLQAYLKAALGELSKPRPAGTATAGASARWAAAAWLALKGGQGAQELDERPLMTVRAELARSGASQAEAWLWAARAGIVDPDTLRRTGPALQFRDDAGPPDERGGCGTAGQGPATVLTALWVMYQAGGARGPAASQSASAPAENPQRVLAARRFCCQMVYRSREAFFAADPDRWVGAVRVRADSAEVTLEACAAALEALLARPGG